MQMWCFPYANLTVVYEVNRIPCKDPSQASAWPVFVPSVKDEAGAYAMEAIQW